MARSAFGVEHGEVSKGLAMPRNIDKPFKVNTARGAVKNALNPAARRNRKPRKQIYQQQQDNALNYRRRENPFGGDNPFG